MRKLSLLIATCTALVAFMGLGGQALADTNVDPDCDGNPYDNSFQVRDLNMGTPDSNVSGRVSGIVGSGLACGIAIGGNTLFHSIHGEETLNHNAIIRTPPGVEVNPGANIQNGAYVGSAQVRVASWGPSLAGSFFLDIDNAVLKKAANGEGDCAGTGAILCLRGDGSAIVFGITVIGHNYSWVTIDGSGMYTLTIGRFYNDTFPDRKAGLSKIRDFRLCAYAGAVGGSACGNSSQPWLQKNGDASAPNCSNGNGIYRVRVNRGDNGSNGTTPEVTKCVEWTPPPPPVDPDCDGTPFSNALAINRFLASTSPTTPGAVSSLGLDGVVCGTDPASSVTDHVDFRLSLGEVIYNNATIGGNLPTGAYAGSLGGRLAYGNVIEAIDTATVRVDELDLRQLNSSFAQPADSCNQEAENGLVGNNPGTDGSWSPGEIPSVIFTCFEVTGRTVSGANFTASLWRTLSGGSTGSASDADFGRNYLTLGPIHIQGQPSTDAGITDISLDLCANAGTSSCGGASDPVVHQNGPSSSCPNGVGRFEAVATRKNRDRTADFSTPGVATSCVSWGARGGERSGDPGGSKLPSEGLSKLPSGGEILGGTSSSTGSKGSSLHGGTKTRGL